MKSQLRRFLIVLLSFVPCALSAAQEISIQVSAGGVGETIGNVRVALNKDGLIADFTSIFPTGEGLNCDLHLRNAGEDEYVVSGTISDYEIDTIDLTLKIGDASAEFQGRIESVGDTRTIRSVNDFIVFMLNDKIYRWYGNKVSLISYSGPKGMALSAMWDYGFQVIYVENRGFLIYPKTEKRYRYQKTPNGWVFCSESLDGDYISPEIDGYVTHARYIRTKGVFTRTDSIIDAVNFLILYYSGIGTDILALYLHDLYYPGLAQIGR